MHCIFKHCQLPKLWEGKKIFSVAICSIYFYTNVIAVYAAESNSRLQHSGTSFWEERKQAVEKFKQKSSLNESLSSLSVAALTNQEPPHAGLSEEQYQLLAQLPQAARLDFTSASNLPLFPTTQPSVPLSLNGLGLKRKERNGPNERKERVNSQTWLPSLILPYGTIKDVFLAKRPDAPLVIHIQDVHEVTEAQKNIALIIQRIQESVVAQFTGGEALEAKHSRPLGLSSFRIERRSKHNTATTPDKSGNYVEQRNELNEPNELNGLVVIGLEGASGSFNLEPYRNYLDPDITKGLAEYFLKEGYIGGPEFAGITAAKAPFLWGVENLDLYQANIQAYRDSVKNKLTIEKLLAASKKSANDLKETVYSPELKEFDRHYNAYKAEQEKLGAYVRYLFSTLTSISTSPNPNLNLFLKALDWEEHLDFQLVEKQRHDLVEILIKELSNDQLGYLVKQSTQYRLGHMTCGDYYGVLKKLCRDNKISLQNFKQLGSYIEYVQIAEQISRGNLLTELTSLEKTVQDSLSVTTEQKRLVEVNRNLVLLDKLITHAMTPEDWEYYEKHRNETISSLSSLSLWERGRGEGEERNKPNGLNELLAPYEQFCELALKRNNALIDNLLSELEAQNDTTDAKNAMDSKNPMNAVAVLVAGGFHTDGLTRIMRQKDVSYIVITPKITEVPKESHYLDVFSRDPLPIEKLLSGEKISLASFRLLAGGAIRDAVFDARRKALHNLFLSARRVLSELATEISKETKEKLDRFLNVFDDADDAKELKLSKTLNGPEMNGAKLYKALFFKNKDKKGKDYTYALIVAESEIFGLAVTNFEKDNKKTNLFLTDETLLTKLENIELRGKTLTIGVYEINNIAEDTVEGVIKWVGTTKDSLNKEIARLFKTTKQKLTQIGVSSGGGGDVSVNTGPTTKTQRTPHTGQSSLVATKETLTLEPPHPLIRNLIGEFVLLLRNWQIPGFSHTQPRNAGLHERGQASTPGSNLARRFLQVLLHPLKVLTLHKQVYVSLGNTASRVGRLILRLKTFVRGHPSSLPPFKTRHNPLASVTPSPLAVNASIFYGFYEKFYKNQSSIFNLIFFFLHISPTLKPAAVNLAIKTGDVTPEEVNSAIKNKILAGEAYKVWDKSQAPTIADDVKVEVDHDNEEFIEKARKYLTDEEQTWLDDADIVVIKGEGLLYFRNAASHQSLHVGQTRHVIFTGEHLWNMVKHYPQSLAAMLAHELYHISHPESPESAAEAREKRIDSAGELRKIISKLVVERAILITGTPHRQIKRRAGWTAEVIGAAFGLPLKSTKQVISKTEVSAVISMAQSHAGGNGVEIDLIENIDDQTKAEKLFGKLASEMGHRFHNVLHDEIVSRDRKTTGSVAEAYDAMANVIITFQIGKTQGEHELSRLKESAKQGEYFLNALKALNISHKEFNGGDSDQSRNILRYIKKQILAETPGITEQELANRLMLIANDFFRTFSTINQPLAFKGNHLLGAWIVVHFIERFEGNWQAAARLMGRALKEGDVQMDSLEDFVKDLENKIRETDSRQQPAIFQQILIKGRSVIFGGLIWLAVKLTKILKITIPDPGVKAPGNSAIWEQYIKSVGIAEQIAKEAVDITALMSDFTLNSYGRRLNKIAYPKEKFRLIISDPRKLFFLRLVFLPLPMFGLANMMVKLGMPMKIVARLIRFFNVILKKLGLLKEPSDEISPTTQQQSKKGGLMELPEEDSLADKIKPGRVGVEWEGKNAPVVFLPPFSLPRLFREYPKKTTSGEEKDELWAKIMEDAEKFPFNFNRHDVYFLPWFIMILSANANDAINTRMRLEPGFAGKGLIQISYLMLDGFLYIYVIDNGIGYPDQTPRTIKLQRSIYPGYMGGMGDDIRKAKEDVAKIKGASLEYRSRLLDEGVIGTKTILRIPLENLRAEPLNISKGVIVRLNTVKIWADRRIQRGGWGNRLTGYAVKGLVEVYEDVLAPYGEELIFTGGALGLALWFGPVAFVVSRLLFTVLHFRGPPVSDNRVVSAFSKLFIPFLISTVPFFIDSSLISFLFPYISGFDYMSAHFGADIANKTGAFMVVHAALNIATPFINLAIRLAVTIINKVFGTELQPKFQFQKGVIEQDEPAFLEWVKYYNDKNELWRLSVYEIQSNRKDNNELYRLYRRLDKKEGGYQAFFEKRKAEIEEITGKEITYKKDIDKIQHKKDEDKKEFLQLVELYKNELWRLSAGILAKPLNLEKYKMDNKYYKLYKRLDNTFKEKGGYKHVFTEWETEIRDIVGFTVIYTEHVTKKTYVRHDFDTKEEFLKEVRKYSKDLPQLSSGRMAKRNPALHARLETLFEDMGGYPAAFIRWWQEIYQIEELEKKFVDYYPDVVKNPRYSNSAFLRFLKKFNPRLIFDRLVFRGVVKLANPKNSPTGDTAVAIERLSGHLKALAVIARIKKERGESPLSEQVQMENINTILGQLMRNNRTAYPLVNIALGLALPDQTEFGDLATDLEFHDKEIEEDATKKIAIQVGLIQPKRPDDLNQWNQIAIIQGPPGTGKTRVIVELARQYAARNKRVLIVSQNNNAVDNALEGLAKAGMRVGRATNASEKISDKTFTWLKSDNDMGKFLLNGAIVGSTLVSLATVRAISEQSVGHFDVILFDEAGMANLAQSLLALSIGGKNTKLVMVGDHNQLAPHPYAAQVKVSHQVFNGDLDISLFKQLIDHGLDQVMLNTQYRSHPYITDLISRLFYDDKLEARAWKEQDWDNLQDRIKLIDTSTILSEKERHEKESKTEAGYWEEDEIKESHSYSNPSEAKLVLEQLQQLESQGIDLENMAVIAFYSEQVKLINDLVNKAIKEGGLRKAPIINTVDSFQGRQQDIVILSFTRSNSEPHRVGFLSNLGRLNVAMSRPSNRLILIGDFHTLKNARSKEEDEITREVFTKLEHYYNELQGKIDAALTERNLNGNTSSISKGVIVRLDAVRAWADRRIQRSGWGNWLAGYAVKGLVEVYEDVLAPYGEELIFTALALWRMGPIGLLVSRIWFTFIHLRAPPTGNKILNVLLNPLNIIYLFTPHPNPLPQGERGMRNVFRKLAIPALISLIGLYFVHFNPTWLSPFFQYIPGFEFFSAQFGADIANKTGTFMVVHAALNVATPFINLAIRPAVAVINKTFGTELTKLQLQKGIIRFQLQMPEDVKKFGLCLTPDSLIHLAEGTTRPLIELKKGDHVLSLNQKTNQLEPHEVVALLDMGVKPVYQITTKGGKTLKTTLNHPYLTKKGWRKLKDIKVGAQIAVLTESGVSSKFPDSSFNNDWKLFQDGGQSGVKPRTGFLSRARKVQADLQHAASLRFQDFFGSTQDQYLSKTLFGHLREFVIPVLDEPGYILKTLLRVLNSFQKDLVLSFFILLLQKLIHIPLPVASQIGFGKVQSFIISRQEKRGFVNTPAAGVDISVRKPVHGIVTNDRSPAVPMKDFNLNDKVSNTFPNPDMLMPPANIGVKLSYKDGFTGLEHTKIITKYPSDFNVAKEKEVVVSEQPRLGYLLNRNFFILKNCSSIMQAGLHIFGGYVGIAIPYNFLYTQPLFNEFNNHVDGYSGPFNARFSKANFRVNRDSVFIHNSIASSENDSESVSWDIITGISYSGNLPVYDVEVEGTHNFIAQGIVAHNTYEKIQGVLASARHPLLDAFSTYFKTNRKTIFQAAILIAATAIFGPTATFGWFFKTTVSDSYIPKTPNNPAASEVLRTIFEENRGEDKIMGAIHEGYENEAKRLNALRRLMKMKGINIENWAEQQALNMREWDKKQLRKALIAIGLNERRIETIMDRIILVEAPSGLKLNGKSSRIGAIIIRTNKGPKILFPKDRLVQALKNKEYLGDLLHEVEEISLIDQGIGVNEAHDRAMEARAKFLGRDTELGLEFDEIMKGGIEKQGTAYEQTPQSIRLRNLDTFLADRAPVNGLVYMARSFQGDHFIVFVDKNYNVLDVAVIPSIPGTVDIDGAMITYGKLAKEIYPAFKKQFHAILKNVKKGLLQIRDRTFEYGSDILTDTTKGNVFLPLINLYYGEKELRNDFINNPIIRTLLKKLRKEGFSRFHEEVALVRDTPWIAGRSFGGYTIYNLYTLKALDDAPLFHKEILSHELAHEAEGNLDEDSKKNLRGYFLKNRESLMTMIKATRMYSHADNVTIAREMIAQIIGYLAYGYIEVYVQDEFGNNRKDDIKATDIDILIKHGLLPSEFEVLPYERERFKKNAGNIDLEYLVRVYPQAAENPILTAKRDQTVGGLIVLSRYLTWGIVWNLGKLSGWAKNHDYETARESFYKFYGKWLAFGLENLLLYLFIQPYMPMVLNALGWDFIPSIMATWGVFLGIHIFEYVILKSINILESVFFGTQKSPRAPPPVNIAASGIIGAINAYFGLSPINPISLLIHFATNYSIHKGTIIPSKSSSESEEDVKKFGLCLTPDSLIHLAEGTTKPLIEIKKGNRVLSLNQKTNQLEPHEVVALLDMGVKPVYQITTKGGKTLKTTLNHPYLTKKGWQKLKDIKVGEEITALADSGVPSKFPDSAFNNGICNKKIAFLPKKIQRFFGSFKRNPSTMKSISQNANSTMNLYLQTFSSFSGFKVISDDYGRERLSSNTQHITFPSMKFKIFDSRFNFRNRFSFDRNNFEIFPSGNFPNRYISIQLNFRYDTRWSKNRRESLKDGYFADLREMDKRSRVNDESFHNLNPILYPPASLYSGVPQVAPTQGQPAELLSGGQSASLNIEPGHHPPTFSSSQFLQLQQSPVQDSGGVFSLLHLISQLLYWTFNSPYSADNNESVSWDIITGIRYVGNLPVYDVEVEGTHNFIAQGIVAHNTYTQAQEAVPAYFHGSKGVIVRLDAVRGWADRRIQRDGWANWAIGYAVKGLVEVYEDVLAPYGEEIVFTGLALFALGWMGPIGLLVSRTIFIGLHLLRGPPESNNEDRASTLTPAPLPPIKTSGAGSVGEGGRRPGEGKGESEQKSFLSRFTIPFLISVIGASFAYFDPTLFSPFFQYIPGFEFLTAKFGADLANKTGTFIVVHAALNIATPFINLVSRTMVAVINKTFGTELSKLQLQKGVINSEDGRSSVEAKISLWMDQWRNVEAFGGLGNTDLNTAMRNLTLVAEQAKVPLANIITLLEMSGQQSLVRGLRWGDLDEWKPLFSLLGKYSADELSELVSIGIDVQGDDYEAMWGLERRNRLYTFSKLAGIIGRDGPAPMKKIIERQLSLDKNYIQNVFLALEQMAPILERSGMGSLVQLIELTKEEPGIILEELIRVLTTIGTNPMTAIAERFGNAIFRLYYPTPDISVWILLETGKITQDEFYRTQYYLSYLYHSNYSYDHYISLHEDLLTHTLQNKNLNIVEDLLISKFSTDENIKSKISDYLEQETKEESKKLVVHWLMSLYVDDGPRELMEQLIMKQDSATLSRAPNLLLALWQLKLLKNQLEQLIRNPDFANKARHKLAGLLGVPLIHKNAEMLLYDRTIVSKLANITEPTAKGLLYTYITQGMEGLVPFSQAKDLVDVTARGKLNISSFFRESGWGNERWLAHVLAVASVFQWEIKALDRMQFAALIGLVIDKARIRGDYDNINSNFEAGVSALDMLGNNFHLLYGIIVHEIMHNVTRYKWNIFISEEQNSIHLGAFHELLSDIAMFAFFQKMGWDKEINTAQHILGYADAVVSFEDESKENVSHSVARAHLEWLIKVAGTNINWELLLRTAMELLEQKDILTDIKSPNKEAFARFFRRLLSEYKRRIQPAWTSVILPAFIAQLLLDREIAGVNADQNETGKWSSWASKNPVSVAITEIAELLGLTVNAASNAAIQNNQLVLPLWVPLLSRIMGKTWARRLTMTRTGAATVIPFLELIGLPGIALGLTLFFGNPAASLIGGLIFAALHLVRAPPQTFKQHVSRFLIRSIASAAVNFIVLSFTPAFLPLLHATHFPVLSLLGLAPLKFFLAYLSHALYNAVMPTSYWLNLSDINSEIIGLSSKEKRELKNLLQKVFEPVSRADVSEENVPPSASEFVENVDKLLRETDPALQLPVGLRGLMGRALVRAAQRLSESDRETLRRLNNRIARYHRLIALRAPGIIIQNEKTGVIEKTALLLKPEEVMSAFEGEIQGFEEMPRSLLMPDYSYADWARAILEYYPEKFPSLLGVRYLWLMQREQGFSPIAILQQFIEFLPDGFKAERAKEVMERLNKGIPPGVIDAEELVGLYFTLILGLEERVGVLTNFDVFEQIYKLLQRKFIETVMKWRARKIDWNMAIDFEEEEEVPEMEELLFAQVHEELNNANKELIQYINYNPGPEPLKRLIALWKKARGRDGKPILTDGEANSFTWLVKNVPKKKGNTRDRRRQSHRYLLRLAENRLREGAGVSKEFMGEVISSIDPKDRSLNDPDGIESVLEFIRNFSNFDDRTFQDLVAGKLFSKVTEWRAKAEGKKQFLRADNFGEMITMMNDALIEQVLGMAGTLTKSEKNRLKQHIKKHSEAWNNRDFLKLVVTYHSFQNEEGRTQTEKFLRQLLKAKIQDGRFTELPRYTWPDPKIKKWLGKKVVDKLRQGKKVEINLPEGPRRIGYLFSGIKQDILEHMGVRGIEDIPSAIKAIMVNEKSKDIPEEELTALLEVLGEVLTGLDKNEPISSEQVRKWRERIYPLHQTGPPVWYQKRIAWREILVNFDQIISVQSINFSNVEKIVFEITDNPVAFVRSGMEPYQTCQRCNEPTGFNSKGRPINRARQGHFLLAQIIAQQKDGTGEVVSRTHLEVARGTKREVGPLFFNLLSLLGKSKRPQPVLLVERLYQSGLIPYHVMQQEILKWTLEDDEFKYLIFAGAGYDAETSDIIKLEFIPSDGEIYRDTFSERDWYALNLEQIRQTASEKTETLAYPMDTQKAHSPSGIQSILGQRVFNALSRLIPRWPNGARLIASLVEGIAEEILFRGGLIYGLGLVSGPLGAGLLIVGQAVIFGLFHFRAEKEMAGGNLTFKQFLKGSFWNHFGFGLAMGTLTLIPSGGLASQLIIPILLHSINNSLVRYGITLVGWLKFQDASGKGKDVHSAKESNLPEPGESRPVTKGPDTLNEIDELLMRQFLPHKIFKRSFVPKGTALQTVEDFILRQGVEQQIKERLLAAYNQLITADSQKTALEAIKNMRFLANRLEENPHLKKLWQDLRDAAIRNDKELELAVYAQLKTAPYSPGSLGWNPEYSEYIFKTINDGGRHFQEILDEAENLINTGRTEDAAKIISGSKTIEYFIYEQNRIKGTFEDTASDLTPSPVLPENFLLKRDTAARQSEGKKGSPPAWFVPLLLFASSAIFGIFTNVGSAEAAFVFGKVPVANWFVTLVSGLPLSWLVMVPFFVSVAAGLIISNKRQAKKNVAKIELPVTPDIQREELAEKVRELFPEAGNLNIEQRLVFSIDVNKQPDPRITLSEAEKWFGSRGRDEEIGESRTKERLSRQNKKFMKKNMDNLYSLERPKNFVEVAAKLRGKYGDEASKKVAAHIANEIASLSYNPPKSPFRKGGHRGISATNKFNNLLAQVALLRALEGWEGRGDRLDIFGKDIGYILNLAYALDPALQGKRKSKIRKALSNLLKVYNESLREAVKLENELQRYEMSLRRNRDIIIDVSKLHAGNEEEKSKITSSLNNLNIALGKVGSDKSIRQIVFVDRSGEATVEKMLQVFSEIKLDNFQSGFKLVTPTMTSSYNLPVFDNDIVNAANLSRYLRGLKKKSDKPSAMDIFTLDGDKWDVSEMDKEGLVTLFVMLLGGLVYNATPGLEKDLKKLTFALIQA